MTPGRNDACPCGSGRKYKKCCLAKEGAARQASAIQDAAAGEPADLRQAALDALTAYSMEGKFGGRVRPFFEVYRLHRPLPEGASEADVHLKFYFYWQFDAQQADGKTVAESFLESKGGALPARQQALLRRLTAARLRLYEVEEVRLDEGLRLLDLRSGESLWVRERSATGYRQEVLVCGGSPSGDRRAG